MATNAAPSHGSSESFPVAHLDLVEEVRQLRASPMPHGHLAKTVVRNADVRIVLMVLLRGAQLPLHHAKGSLIVNVLDGRVVITLLEASFDLGPHSVLAIEPEIRHAIVAIEDTSLMLTIAHAGP